MSRLQNLSVGINFKYFRAEVVRNTEMYADVLLCVYYTNVVSVRDKKPLHVTCERFYGFHSLCKETL